MYKAAVGLYVTDGKRLETIGCGVGMDVALERRVDCKITWSFLAVFGAGFGSAERYRDEMNPASVGRGKRERESHLDEGRKVTSLVDRAFVGRRSL